MGLGSLIESVGKLTVWCSVAAISAAGLTALFALNTLPGFVYCAALALPQAAVLTAVYPLVPKYVDLDSEGFAFGILVSAQNAGMAIANYGNGVILGDSTARPENKYVALLFSQVAMYTASALLFWLLQRMPGRDKRPEEKPLTGRENKV